MALPLPIDGGDVGIWGPKANALWLDHESRLQLLEALGLAGSSGGSLTITSAVQVTVNGDTVVAQYNTSANADTKLQIGSSTGNYDYAQGPYYSATLVAQHTATIQTVPNATYFGQVVSTDAFGHTVKSPEFTFTVNNVAGTDTTPPVVTIVGESGTTTTHSYDVVASETTTITKKIRPHFVAGSGSGSTPSELARGTFNHAANATTAAGSMTCALPTDPSGAAWNGKYAIFVFWTTGATSSFATSLSFACTTILTARATDTSSSTGTRINVFGRRLDGTEGASLAATPNATTDYASRCYVFDNVDVTTPLDGVTVMETDLMTAGGTSSSPLSSIQATGTSANSLAICILADNPNSVPGQAVTVASPWIESDDEVGTNKVHGGVAKQQMTAGGATGACVWTLLTAAKCVSATFSLRAAGSGSPGAFLTTGTATGTSFTVLYDNLTAGNQYDYEIDCVDVAGNVGTPLTGTFTAATVAGSGGGSGGTGTGNLSSYIFGSTTGTVNVTESALHATSLPVGSWNGTSGGRSSDLILVAPGWTEGMAPTCQVLDKVVLQSQNRIVFKGFDFVKGVDFGQMLNDATNGHYPCDLIGLYFCNVHKIGDPNATPPGSSSSSEDLMGLMSHGSTRCWTWGTNVYETYDDTIHTRAGGYLAMFAFRQWAACQVGTVHNDGWQVDSGTIYAEGGVLGCSSAVHPATIQNYGDGGHGGFEQLPTAAIVKWGNSDFQIKNDFGPVTATLKDIWILDSDRPGVTVDNRGANGGTVTASLTNVRVWAIHPADSGHAHLAVLVGGSPNLTQSNVTLDNPPTLSDVPPDIALINANPTYAAARAYILAAVGF